MLFIVLGTVLGALDTAMNKNPYPHVASSHSGSGRQIQYLSHFKSFYCKVKEKCYGKKKQSKDDRES